MSEPKKYICKTVDTDYYGDKRNVLFPSDKVCNDSHFDADEGEYVLYSYYAALQAENQRLTANLKACQDEITASEKTIPSKYEIRECLDETTNSWGCVDLPASIKGIVRKLEVADNHAEALYVLINAGTANELRLKSENERLRKESIAGMHLRSDVISWLGDDHDFLDDYQKAMDAAKEVQL